MLSGGRPIWEKTCRQSGLLLFDLCNNKLFQNLVAGSKHFTVLLCWESEDPSWPVKAQVLPEAIFTVLLRAHSRWFGLSFLGRGWLLVISGVMWHLASRKESCWDVRVQESPVSLLPCSLLVRGITEATEILGWRDINLTSWWDQCQRTWSYL